MKLQRLGCSLHDYSSILWSLVNDTAVVTTQWLGAQLCLLQQLERKCSFQPAIHNPTGTFRQFKFPIWSNSQLIDWDVICICSLIIFHQIFNGSSHLSLNMWEYAEKGGSSTIRPSQIWTRGEAHWAGLLALPLCLLQFPEGKRDNWGMGAVPPWGPDPSFLCPFSDRSAGTVGDFFGACCRSSPGHKGNLSTAVREGNERLWMKLRESFRLERREWQEVIGKWAPKLHKEITAALLQNLKKENQKPLNVQHKKMQLVRASCINLQNLLLQGIAYRTKAVSRVGIWHHRATATCGEVLLHHSTAFSLEIHEN